MANSLRTIRTELAETGNEMLTENISLLNDKLHAAGRDRVSRFGELNSKLHTLEEQVTATGRVLTQHSMGNKQKGKSDVWLTVHRNSVWIRKPTRCHILYSLFLF